MLNGTNLHKPLCIMFFIVILTKDVETYTKTMMFNVSDHRQASH